MSYKYEPLIEAVAGSTDTDNVDVPCDCPRCGKHKLYMNRDTGLFLCFSCSFSGRPEDLVAELHGITPKAARPFLRRYTTRVSANAESIRNGILKAAVRQVKKRDDTPMCVNIPKTALPIRGTKGEKYLHRRGFRRGTYDAYRLMYVPRTEYSFEYAPENGHIIFPCYGKGDSLEFWTSRAAWDPVTRGPKSTNPVGVSKKSVLYGLYELAPDRSDGRIALVEGPLDAIALDGRGCALLGKHLSDLQIKRLYTKCRNGIIVCLDAEELKQSWEAAARIARWRDSAEVYVGSTYPYKDAAEALADGMDPMRIIRKSAVRFTDSAYTKALVTVR